jgi:hypothetical protein
MLPGKATTVAKVGFFLEQHKERLWSRTATWSACARADPATLHLSSGTEARKLISNWNLIVPPEILERSWQEIL